MLLKDPLKRLEIYFTTLIYFSHSNGAIPNRDD